MFNIINRKTLLAYCKKYPKAENALLSSYYDFLNVEFKNFQELKEVHKSASLVKENRIVINIMGYNYRLVIRVIFVDKVIQIKWFGTHKEYDKIDISTIYFKL